MVKNNYDAKIYKYSTRHNIERNYCVYKYLYESIYRYQYSQFK